MPVTVIASPAERFVLCQILFQASEEGKPLLEIQNAAEGRALRRFLRGLALEPIRYALTRHGRVSDELARDDGFALYEVTDDAAEFFKTKVLNLPRTAMAEAVAGDLLDSLHGLGPGPYGRGDAVSMELGLLQNGGAPGAEDWSPRAKTRPASGMWLPFTPLQLAMDEFSHAIESGPPLPPHAQTAVEELQERMGGLVRAALSTTSNAGGTNG